MNKRAEYERWKERAVELWVDIGPIGRFATYITLAVTFGFLLGRCTAS